jgi:hypothetical protein
LNPGRRGGKPATNGFSYGAAPGDPWFESGLDDWKSLHGLPDILQHLSTKGWNLEASYTYLLIVIPFNGKLCVVYGIPTGAVSEFSAFLPLIQEVPRSNLVSE